MFRMFSKVSESLGLSYPGEYLSRIQLLKRLAEKELEKVVDEILTRPQHIVDHSQPMLLSDAIAVAISEGRNIVEVGAPLLTFPKATKEQWNGDIDHVDTIEGIYNLYIGSPHEVRYGDHLLKKFKGAPTVVSALRKALGDNYQVTMSVDAMKSPASRFIIVIPRSLMV